MAPATPFLATPDRVCELVRDHLQAETSCATPTPDDRRVGCVTPLDYPDGDAVLVWVSPQVEDFEVTDYGESLTDFLTHSPQERTALVESAATISRRHGVSFQEGRVVTRCGEQTLGDAVWRVANASMQIAQSTATFRPRRRPQRENLFAVEVQRDLIRRNVPVERDRRLSGMSGHDHNTTLYLPYSGAILEPLSAEGHWNQVSTIYAKFGDLRQANGYRSFSLIDDREGQLREDLANLLVQVSAVIQWSRREEWVETLQ